MDTLEYFTSGINNQKNILIFILKNNLGLLNTIALDPFLVIGIILKKYIF